MRRNDFLPFGEELTGGVAGRTAQRGYSPTNINQKFTGHERDASTGYDHTLWRKPDSVQGRWTSPAPYGGSMEIGNPQSFNRYSYVLNDPVNLMDPLGLHPRQTSCTLDGIAFDCAAAMQMVDVGAAVIGPENSVRYNSHTGQFEHFMAYADGRAGWYGTEHVSSKISVDGEVLFEDEEYNFKQQFSGQLVSWRGSVALKRNGDIFNLQGRIIAEAPVEWADDHLMMALPGGAFGFGFGGLRMVGPALVKGEASRLAGQWGRGSFNHTFELIKHSFAGHGHQVGAKDVWSFLRKAEGFNTKGATKKILENGATRYTRKDGTFLIKDVNGKNVSFGKNRRP